MHIWTVSNRNGLRKYPDRIGQDRTEMDSKNIYTRTESDRIGQKQTQWNTKTGRVRYGSYRNGPKLTKKKIHGTTRTEMDSRNSYQDRISSKRTPEKNPDRIGQNRTDRTVTDWRNIYKDHRTEPDSRKYRNGYGRAGLWSGRTG